MLETLERRSLFAITPDPTFPNGVEALPADSSGVNGAVAFLEVLSDGKIVTGGLIDLQNDPSFRVARFNADGTPDTTFGGGDGLSPLVGSIPDALPLISYIDGAVGADGKIVLATVNDTGYAVAKFNADGSADTSFGGGDGFMTVGDLASASNPLTHPAVAVAADGDILLIGGSENSTFFYVTRLNADGTFDSTFRNSGQSEFFGDEFFDFQGAGISPVTTRDIAALPGGKMLLLVDIHGTGGPGQIRPALVQLEPDGDYDPTFSGDGKLPFEFTVDANPDESGVILVQGDGKIVVVGSDQSQTAITRFSAAGTRDTTFGTGGVGYADLANQREPYHITADDDGNFVIAIASGITRFTSGGDPDTQFAPGGTDNTGVSASVIDMDAQGRALIASGGELKRILLDAEDRPDVALSSNGTLIITGESGTADNTISVSESGSNVVVTRNGVQSTFARDQVADVDIVTFDGDDTVTVSVANFPARVNLGDGANEVTLGDGNAIVQGGDGVDDITIGDGNHVVEAGGGNDAVTIGDGSGNGVGSTIFGGAGDDSITAGAGDDQIAGEAGSDSIDGGARNDTIFGGLFIDRVFGNLDLAGEPDGQNVLIGGDGGDLLVGAGNRDTLRGGAHTDTLVGLAGADLLSGGGGKDRLAGFGGHDRMYGGAGDDQFAGGNHDDRISGGDGDDTIFGHDGRDVLHGDAGNDVFLAQDDAIDTLDGGDGDDTLLTSDQDDVLSNIETT